MTEFITEILATLIVGSVVSVTSLVADYREDLCEDYLGGTYTGVDKVGLKNYPGDDCPTGKWRSIAGIDR